MLYGQPPLHSVLTQFIHFVQVDEYIFLIPNHTTSRLIFSSMQWLLMLLVLPSISPQNGYFSLKYRWRNSLPTLRCGCKCMTTRRWAIFDPSPLLYLGALWSNVPAFEVWSVIRISWHRPAMYAILLLKVLDFPLLKALKKKSRGFHLYLLCYFSVDKTWGHVHQNLL